MVAEETIVLLKNEDGLLPLSEKEEIAFIGKYARQPRFQGGGSSHINSHKVTGAWDVVKDWGNITFAEGYGDQEDVTDEALIAEAVEKRAFTTYILIVFFPSASILLPICVSAYFKLDIILEATKSRLSRFP